MKSKAFISHSREKIREQGHIERKYVIEAMVMRILKSKKKLSHEELMEEIIKEEEYF